MTKKQNVNIVEQKSLSKVDKSRNTEWGCG